MIIMGESVQGGRSKLLVTARDMSIPPVSTSVTASSGVAAMREAAGELEKSIPGMTSAINLDNRDSVSFLWYKSGY